MKILDKNLDLLKKINSLKINNVSICDIYSYKNISTWSFQQVWLWDRLLTVKNKKEKKSTIDFLTRIRIRFRNMVWYSILAILTIVKLRANKTKILVYSIAKSKKDFRLVKVFNFLEKNDIKYGEVVHGYRSKLYNTKLVFFTGLVNYIFPAKKISHQFDLGDFEDDQRDDLKLIINDLLANAAQSEKKIKFLKWYLKLAGIDTLLAIDDPRYYNELIVAAQELNIKVIVFQHGRFNKYLTGWINYNVPPEKCIVPDKFVVWNKYWRDKLITLSPAHKLHHKKIFIGGQPFYSNNEFLINKLVDQLVVLIPFELKADKEAVKKCIQQLLLIPRLKVFFKARPDQSINEQLRVSGLGEFESRANFIVIQQLTKESLEEVNLVIGTYSTLLYEMIEVGKPVIVLKSNNTQADDLVMDGLAEFLTENASELGDQLKNVANISIDVLKERKNIITTQVDIDESLKNILKPVKVVGVIPARLQSTRLARKMLIDINGKPLIYHTWKRAQEADILDEVIVATDSKEIFDIISKEEGRVIMTSEKCLSGTDRVAEAIDKLTDISPEIVVNIQGDEPLVPIEAITKIVKKLEQNFGLSMATAAVPFSSVTAAEDSSNVKVVIDQKGQALYFTRSLVVGALHHLGIYAYRRDFLSKFVKLPQSFLEKSERLEQLRALENDYKIGVVVGDWQSIGIDTEVDLERFKNGQWN